jgi:hypothetical protein
VSCHGTDEGSSATDAGAQPINLIPDPSFEAGHLGWNGFSGYDIVDVIDPDTGYKCIRTENRSASWHGPKRRVDSLVSAGARYQVGAWTRVAVGLEPTTLMLITKCQGASTLYTVLQGGSAGDAWSQRLGEFTAPTCTLESLEIFIEGPAGGIDFYVDDVSLIALE